MITSRAVMGICENVKSCDWIEERMDNIIVCAYTYTA